MNRDESRQGAVEQTSRACETIPLIDLPTRGIPALGRELERKGIALVQVEPGDVEGRELRGLVSTLGIADPHNAGGRDLWDVRYDPTAGESAGVRSRTTLAFPFHTDGSFENPPPDYIALYVVREDWLGGGSTLILEASVLDRISPTARRTLQSTSYRFRVPAEFDKGVPHRDLPILLSGGRVRYRREIIDESFCTPVQLAAMDELDAAIESATPTRLFLRSGMILFLDNARFLHARTEVLDPDRHLLRMRFSTDLNEI